jgi:hypothetical protein
MSRTLYLSMEEADVVVKCEAASVGISAIERLPEAGVRLVCMSVHGAEVMRAKLKSHLIKDTAERFRFRPSRPLW